MIGELIFAAISGAIVSYILMKFLISRQKKKRSNPKRILEKLKKDDKTFFVEGKKIDLIEEIKKGMIKQPNAPTEQEKELEDLQEKDRLLKEEIKKEKEKQKNKTTIVNNAERQPGKTSLNKILGKK